MRKIILLSFLMLSSVQLLAGVATTVRLNPNNAFAVYGTTNTTFQLGSSAASGDATSDSAPAKIYVPMDGPSTPINYFIEPSVTSLFTATNSATINFPLYLNATSTDFYLYVAIKDPTNVYKLAKQFSVTPFNGTTDSDQIFPVSPIDFCTQTADCTDFATVSGTEKTHLAYFFFSTSNGLALGSVIDPTVATGGIFFEVNMSNRIYQSASVIPSITTIRSGDRRVIIEYTSNASILQPRSVRILNYNGNPSGAGKEQPIRTSFGLGTAGSLLSTEYDYNANGEITVKDLENGSQYYLALTFVDQYKFATVVSDDQLGEPKQIEELLKKNSCFLLTAGFGEDHYVINYFRHFRDTILVNSFLGREFIHVYYALAPKYALMIYTHDGIRAMIRGMAYSLYFIFNYIFLIITFAIGLIVLLFIKKNFKKTKLNH
jgi:hypothetical protein